MYLISVIVFVVLLLLGISFDFLALSFSGSSLAYFVDLPSLILTVIPALLFAVAGTSWNTAGAAMRNAFRAQVTGRPRELEAHNRFFEIFGSMALTVGAIATVVGFILLFQNITDLTALYPASAVALVTLLYGLILKVLCQAARWRAG